MKGKIVMPRPAGSKNKPKKATIEKVKKLLNNKRDLHVKLFSPSTEPENMAGRDKGGKFTPGNNIGALKSHSARLREELGTEKCAKVLDMLWEAAEGGKMEALIFIAERLYPNRERVRTYVHYEFGSLETISDLDKEIEKLCSAMGSGALQIEAGEKLIDFLDKKRKFIFESRVQVMMDAMKAQNQTNMDLSKIASIYN